MFKAVKMKRLKFLLLSFVLGCAYACRSSDTGSISFMAPGSKKRIMALKWTVR